MRTSKKALKQTKALLSQDLDLQKVPADKTLTEAIIFGGTKQLLSCSFFKLARKAVTRCKRHKTKNININVLEVYILVIVGLEALINEICLDKIDQRNSNNKSIRSLSKIVERDEKKHNMDLKIKYDKLPKVLWRKKFDKGNKTWCDFDALINLRNEIVHYLPKWESPNYIPGYMRSIYLRLNQNKKISDKVSVSFEDAIDSNPCFMSRICNVHMSVWAFDTGINMINELFKLWPKKDQLRADYILMFERQGIKIC
jgi:hypothetical protein